MILGSVIITYNPSINELQAIISNITSSVKEVVIVDNSSQNITEIEGLKNLFFNVTLLQLPSNMGIGYAQNKGINYFFNQDDIEGVVVFDHDSLPSIEMISVLAATCQTMLDQGTKVAAIGPVFIDPRTNNQYPISVFSGFRLLKKYPAIGDNTPIEASFLIASGSLIERSAFKNVGGMNEGFFIDYIDIEWSFRAKNKGYQLFACPNAKMGHRVGDDRLHMFGREISIHSPLRRYYLARNSILMLKINYIDWKYKVREVFYTFSRVFVFLIFVNKKMTYLKYILKGWQDGIKGKMGPYLSSNH